MNQINKLQILLISLLLLQSCDKGFDDLNTSKTAPIAIDPVFILNRASLGMAYPTGTLIYDIGIVQQIISPNEGVLTGANRNQTNRGAALETWQNYYRNVIKNTKDVLALTKDDAVRSNLFHMARILQANAFMILTDTYGDIPYAQGGGGYTDQVFFPEYQSQQSIYADLIKELTEASAALDAAKRVESVDVLFSGNILKWKKFGYSLLLRAGMRLKKADAAKAQAAVAAAFSGGVILNNADNASIRHDANYTNTIGNTLNSTEAANFYLTKPFVDSLKVKNDPRLSAIAIRYVGATSGVGQTVAAGTTVSDSQKGMPMGKDNSSANAAAIADGFVNYYEYSQLDRRRLGKLTAPNFLVTAAQTNLLLSEARQLGWIAGAVSAAEYFSNGIKAHMDQLGTVDAGSTVSNTARDTYASSRVTAFTGNEIREINYEYWIASFLNGPETFANFRRSGFPALAPNPYPGSEVPGAFINRLVYPASEVSVNTANVNAAVAAQGPDNLATKLWWQK